MGAQIAALLANVGIPVLLLDLAPSALLPAEAARGLTLQSPGVRERIVRERFDRMRKLAPAPFFVPEAASLVTLGNVEDDLGAAAEADWIVEAILERLDLKRELHRRLAQLVRPGTLVTTNTSGLPIARIAEGLPADYARRFFATHFFNPPRYLRLVELVPGPATDPILVRQFTEFASEVLGKTTVVAKDTPGFVANRIGCYDLQSALWLMSEEGLTVAAVDAITGPALGRPRSATCRLCDVVGIDLLAQVCANLRSALAGEEERRILAEPGFLGEMITRGWWGEKAGQGFYRRRHGLAKGEVEVLDYRSLTYGPAQAPDFASLAVAGKERDVVRRVRELCAAEDAAGRFAWKHLSRVLCYAAQLVPEIADDLVTIDEAMKCGYNWQLGPFELWDALGVAATARRLESEGRPVPSLVRQLLDSGGTHFHVRRAGRRLAFAPAQSEFVDRPEAPRVLRLERARSDRGVIRSDPGASLLDLGDGVACLEFHTKMNILGDAQLTFLREALEVVRQDFAGLVIGNESPNFSAGLNLTELAERIRSRQWSEIAATVGRFQDTAATLRQFERPVVAACAGFTLAGGCELAMGCTHIMAAGEVNLGLPETRVGLIPGAQGTKEMLIRCTEGILRLDDADYFAGVRTAWETLRQAKIGSSAPDAARLRYLRTGEWTLVMNIDWLLGEAKAKVLQLAPGYRAPRPRSDLPAIGQPGIANLRATLHNLSQAGQCSDHDCKIGARLAHVLCGGELSSLQFVSERYFLELEREAFLGLCGEPKTLERIEHMLNTGKPLHN